MDRIKNIKDLANLAGVSAGTVSRALAGSDLISAKTRDKVRALADEHGFRLNVLARNLRTRRTGAIGVLIPDTEDPGHQIVDQSFFTMLGPLAGALAARGYDLVLSRVVSTDGEWLERFVDSGRVDGLIVIGQSERSASLDEVAARYRPLVAWGGQYEGQVHCSVGLDNRLSGELATNHLIERGCRRITFVGDTEVLEVSQRLQGCRDAMRFAGLEEDELTVLPARRVAEAAHPDIKVLLGPPDERLHGIVAASDMIAMIILRVLAENDLKVPRDARVIGYNGLAIEEHTVPRLTTISQDLSRGAESLVDTLLRRIAGEDVPSVVMEPRLVIRSSS